MPTPRRPLRILAFAVVAAAMLVPASAQSARPIPKVEMTATLYAIKDVTAQPVFGSKTLSAVADQRPITLTPTALPVIATKTDEAGRAWLQVRLPGRVFHRKTPPKKGWMTADGTKLAVMPWHLVVDIRTRSVIVFNQGRKVRSWKVVVGKPATPTPRGEFFVEEGMRLPRKNVGYPFALATSARSSVFKEFMGGPGQIAMHGMVNIPGSKMGTAASNGCIRMTTSAILWLAKRIKAGTPLTVR